MRFDSVPYMTYAKTVFNRPDIHNLGTSGILKLIPPEELEIGPADYPREISNDDGLPALREAIAARYSVRPERVLIAEGTSLANFLLLAAAIRPGDPALLEEPYYGPLGSVLRTLDARVRCVPVDGPDGHGAILDHILRDRGPRPRAVVVTNPHNPTGRVIGDALLSRIGDACAGIGAILLVDEVYREILFEDPPGCAARLSPAIASTASLTKAWGLSHLRIGWGIGPPDLVARATRVNDNLGVVHPFIAEAVGARIIADRPRMDRWRDRARARLLANRASVQSLLDAVPEIEGPISETGLLSFLRWRGTLRLPDADTLCEAALREARIGLAPGRFFQRPDRIRIGAGQREEKVASACEALAAFLRGA